MSTDYVGQQGITHNHDIEGLIRRIHRFIAELVKSQSSGTSAFVSFDKARLTSYFDAVERYYTWVTSQPQLDLPETHPQAYTVPSLPNIPELENDDIVDLVNLWKKMRDEIINSQSSRHSSGLIPPDKARFEAILGKMRAFLADYVDDTEPLDLPESSPRAEMYGSGRTGV